VQLAVDGKHTPIAAHNVVSDPTDHVNQLEPLALFTKLRLMLRNRRGRYGIIHAETICAPENENISRPFPRRIPLGNQHTGLFTKDDCIYDAQADAYTCPQGEAAISSLRPCRKRTSNLLLQDRSVSNPPAQHCPRGGRPQHYPLGKYGIADSVDACACVQTPGVAQGNSRAYMWYSENER